MLVAFSAFGTFSFIYSKSRKHNNVFNRKSVSSRRVSQSPDPLIHKKLRTLYYLGIFEVCMTHQFCSTKFSSSGRQGRDFRFYFRLSKTKTKTLDKFRLIFFLFSAVLRSSFGIKKPKLVAQVSAFGFFKICRKSQP